MKSLGSICWVVAMSSEARPIIDKLAMVSLKDDNRFKVFRNQTGDHWLIISGIGQINCAAATTYLYHISQANQNTGWINVGIAGSGFGNYGQLYAVDKVENSSTGKILFPVCQVSKNQIRSKLFTVERPSNIYPRDALVDMEGFSFFMIASRLVVKELILILKVISDGPKNNLHELDEGKVASLMIENLPVILKLVDRLRALSADCSGWVSEPKTFKAIISKWHFTVSQKVQLKDVLRRFYSIDSKSDLSDLLKNLKDAKSIIAKIEDSCNEYEIDWRQY